MVSPPPNLTPTKLSLFRWGGGHGQFTWSVLRSSIHRTATFRKWWVSVGVVCLQTHSNLSLPVGKTGRITANHNTESESENIITSPLASEPQGSVMVGGSGVKTVRLV